MTHPADLPSPSPELRDAMTFIGFELAGTGGNCTAWMHREHEHEFDYVETLITVPDDPTAPLSLSDPCIVGQHHEDRDPEPVEAFPTVAAAILELYRRSGEDATTPAELGRCREVVTGLDFDFGSLMRPDYGAILEAGTVATELVTFHPLAFNHDGTWRADVIAMLAELVADARRGVTP